MAGCYTKFQVARLNKSVSQMRLHAKQDMINAYMFCVCVHRHFGLLRLRLMLCKTSSTGCFKKNMVLAFFPMRHHRKARMSSDDGRRAKQRALLKDYDVAKEAGSSHEGGPPAGHRARTLPILPG